MCSAKNSPGSRHSNLVSTILNKAADAANADTECMSTEEALRKMLEANRDIALRAEADEAFKREVKNMILLSMDVNALYPSLVIEETCPILYTMLLRLQDEGKFVVADIDWREAGKFLAIACTEEEIKKLSRQVFHVM